MRPGTIVIALIVRSKHSPLRERSRNFSRALWTMPGSFSLFLSLSLFLSSFKTGRQARQARMLVLLGFDS